VTNSGQYFKINNMKYNILLTIILLIFSFSESQATEKDSIDSHSKNTVYAGIGANGFDFLFNINVNYERLVFSIKKRSFVNFYARAGIGQVVGWETSGPSANVNIQCVFGSKRSHFEIGIGCAAWFDKIGYPIGVSNANFPYPGYTPEPTKLDYTSIYQFLTLGYRYQRPTSGFVFRTGISIPFQQNYYPDNIYLSLGYAF
jgi:hypothetical protein